MARPASITFAGIVSGSDQGCSAGSVFAARFAHASAGAERRSAASPPTTTRNRRRSSCRVANSGRWGSGPEPAWGLRMVRKVGDAQGPVNRMYRDGNAADGRWEGTPGAADEVRDGRLARPARAPAPVPRL